MTSARREIFRDIKAALADVPSLPPGEETPIPWVYGDSSTASAGKSPTDDAVIALFVERCSDYGAVVVRTATAECAATLAKMAAERNVRRLAAPPQLDNSVRSALQKVAIQVVDCSPISAVELDQLDGVVTACRLGIASTGTVVLDHAPDQGPRALSLVPDLHLCLIRANQIVPDVPDAVSALRPSVLAGRPLTWISGPSATVDIEFTRVQGVHGPRTLLVVVAE
jgi:L-lactate dehydrogenase complex protein LldG